MVFEVGPSDLELGHLTRQMRRERVAGMTTIRL